VAAQAAIRYTKVKVAASLSAKIVDQNGDPIAGATVEEVDENWQEASRSTNTDATGRFGFSTVKGGIYYIMVRAKNSRQTEFPMKVNSFHWKALKIVIEIAA
jgi:uncharacterized GH25 family protein